MKKRNQYLVYFTIVFLFACFVPSVYAMNTISVKVSPSSNAVERGEEFSYSVQAFSEISQDIAAFRIVVTYDDSAVVCKGMEPSSETSKEQFKYSIDQDKITVIFIEKENGPVITPNCGLSLFSIKFAALKEVNFGTVAITAEIDGIADNDVNQISCSSITVDPMIIVPTKEADCTLKSLEVSEGNLSPNFSPTITKYTVDVPYSVDRIEVYAEASDETATVKVSRKTLEKAGVPTEIKVTVTAKDKESKLVYTITVNRARKGDNESSSENNKSSTKATRSGTSGTTSQKSASSSASNKASSTNNGLSESDAQNLAAQNVSKNANSASAEKAIIVNQNKFYPFLVGILTMACPAVIYIIYQNRKKKKKNSEESNMK